MAFIFEIDYDAPHRYTADFIEAMAKSEGVALKVLQSGGRITLMGDETDEKLAPFLQKLGESLPASLYMGDSSHRIVEGVPPKLQEAAHPALPCDVGLCGRCLQEMLDPASRRYYYPFTMCQACGPQSSFLFHYPYMRDHTAMRFFQPCDACEKERGANPFREEFPLLSCHACGVPVRMVEGKKERFANDAASFKRLFEAAAGALVKGKRLKIKTLSGWRLFFDAAQCQKEPVGGLFLADAGQAKGLCALIDAELHALLSIERPVLEVAVADESLWALYGRTTTLKAPDEGFTLLLARELAALGVAHIAYRDADETVEADLTVDYDLDLAFSPDTRLFVNKWVRFPINGGRGVFPQWREGTRHRVVAFEEMAAVPYEGGVLVDRMERFDTVEATELWLPEGEASELSHSKTRRFTRAEASMVSVLMEHDALTQKAVGVHFHDLPRFLYYDGRRPIVAIPPAEALDGALQERLETLREGSDRLVARFAERFEREATALFGGVGDLWEGAAAIMGLEGEPFEAVREAALAFRGKGGVQVDMTSGDNRFDPYPFLASLMSYRMAGIEIPLLAYSIFESFGDYIAQTLTDLKRRAKCETVAVCGLAFSSQSLFSRLQQKMGREAFIMNRALPVDGENALLGALAL